MSIFFVVKTGSEADVKLAAYFKTLESNFRELKKLAKEFGVSGEETLIKSSGEVCGFKLTDRKLPNDDWKYCKDYSSYGFPRCKKTTKELRARILSLPANGAENLCRHMFGTTAFHFVGLTVHTAPGYQRIGDRPIFRFASEEMRQDLLGRKGGVWPKGLRLIKGSTVEKWKEEI